MKPTRLLLLSLASLLVACGATDDSVEPVDKGDLTSPPIDGKADISDRVVDGGPLAFGPEAAVSGVFDEDLQFFGWHLHVRDGSSVTLDVTQKGSSRGLDTTLYVYGPKTPAGGYGATALAFDDDEGWGTLSRLRELSLPSAGEYLVVVGTYNGRGRGNFRLEATCLTGDCTPETPPDPVVTDCHPAIASAILACVEDQANDPDYDPSVTTRLDLIEACADAEPVAPAWDELCAQSNPPQDVCGSSFEQFATTYLPACGRELVGKELDATCVFGSTYPDIWNRPGAVIVLSQRTLTVSDALSALEQEQVVAAVRTTAYSEVTTVEEAFSAVDEGIVNQVELWDASNRRAFTSYEVGAGDNSFGMIFAHGTVEPAARINDTDLYDCNVFWGPEMRPCGENAHCQDGLSCTGVPEAAPRGRCIDTAKDDHPAIGSECSVDDPCPAGSGLVCAGGFLCNPGWMRGRFVSEPDLPIPDATAAGADAQLVAYGLSTVSTDVSLDLFITHEQTSDLVVSVINPAGTEVVVFDKGPASSEIYLRSFPVIGFPGDESANGVWMVRAVDTKTGATGTIRSFALTITSRWD